MNYQIDNNDIIKSFDNIAEMLLNESILLVNNEEFEITEIEFYYFYEKVHEDKYTHPHNRKSGEWRFHNQGLDITLEGTEIQDGGILLRGLKKGNVYVNGPIKTVQLIFETFNSVSDCNCLQIKETSKGNKKILKTFRHLPNKITYSDFHDKPYRYLTELDLLEIPESTKKLILVNSTVL